MAQSTVKLIVDAQNAIIPLQRVNQQTQALTNTTDKLKKRLDNSNQSFRNVGKSAQASSAGVATLTKSMAPLLKLLALAGTARFIFVQTAELETQAKALEVLTGSAEKAQDIVQEIKEFGAVTPFKSSDLIEVTKRLKAFGFETEEVVDITKRVADIAGTAGADIDNVALAIGKVQAKNKFMQEENVMLLEKGINVTKELENITGMTGDQLAEAMSKGQISAEQFKQAIINLTNAGGEFFEGASKQSDTLNGKFSTLQDNVETFAQNLGKIFEPAFEFIIDQLNTIFSKFNEIFKLLTDAQIGASNIKVGTASFKARLGMQSDAVQDITEAISLLDPALVKTEEDAAKMLAQLERISKVKDLAIGPDNAAVLEGRGLLDPLMEADFQITDLRKKINSLDFSKLDQIDNNNQPPKTPPSDNLTTTKTELTDTQKLVKSIKEKNELLAARLNGNEQEVAQRQAELELIQKIGIFDAARIFDLQDRTRELQKQNDVLDKQKDLFTQIGDSIATGISDALTDAIMGAKSLGDAARNILNDLASSLLRLGINTLLKSTGFGIFANLPGFADGGRPPVGKPSIVGERGPELFIPDTAGTIIPNDELAATEKISNAFSNPIIVNKELDNSKKLLDTLDTITNPTIPNNELDESKKISDIVINPIIPTEESGNTEKISNTVTSPIIPETQSDNNEKLLNKLINLIIPNNQLDDSVKISDTAINPIIPDRESDNNEKLANTLNNLRIANNQLDDRENVSDKVTDLIMPDNQLNNIEKISETVANPIIADKESDNSKNLLNRLIDLIIPKNQFKDTKKISNTVTNPVNKKLFNTFNNQSDESKAISNMLNDSTITNNESNPNPIIADRKLDNSEKVINILNTPTTLSSQFNNDSGTEIPSPGVLDIKDSVDVGKNLGLEISDALTNIIMPTKISEDSVDLRNSDKLTDSLMRNTTLEEVSTGVLDDIHELLKSPPSRSEIYTNEISSPINQPLISRENAPEIFTPRPVNTVSPDTTPDGASSPNAMGTTNIVVNVDASGSSIEGDEEKGREFGRLISVAVQSEIIQQKRPGGLLA